MKFIVLVGKDDTGKTITLKSVIDELIAKGAKIINNQSLRKFGSYVSSASQLPVPKQNEITILLEYNKKLIGITTYGDTEGVLKNKIEKFENIKCDCIIFGSHPGGSSYEYLIDLANKYNFQEFHAIFKIGCAGITNQQNLKKLQDDSDNQAKNEVLYWI